MYKPYPKYKESGVAWLGEVPEGWEYTRLKFLGFSYGGLSGKSGKDFNQKENNLSKPFIPFTNIANSSYIKDDFFGLVIINQDEVQNKVKQNDLFFLMSSEGYEDLGKASLLEFEVDELYLNSFCKGFRLIDRTIYPQYLNYLLSGDIYRKLLYTQGNGFTRINLRLERLNDLQLLVAPFQEQTQIANYLDQKTKKIDTLIEKQQTLIELLKEKRQALISHVVTKGLDDSVPMKESGVAWLGEVPEGWEVLHIKRLCFVKRGASPRPIENPIYFDENGEYAWVRISDVTSSDMYLEKTVQKLSALGKSLSVPLEPNDLFLSIAGSVGKPMIANIKCCIHDGFVYFQRYKENLKFLYWVFKSGQPYLGLGKFGTQLNLNKDTVGDIKIGLPPLTQQTQIANYLDEKTKKIDTLIEKSKHSIELLKERRTALISAVVTGKVDVRGFENDDI